MAMTVITAEQPHIKYGIAILIRGDLKVKGVSVWQQDNVEQISIGMHGGSCTFRVQPTKREVCTTSTRIQKPTSYYDWIFEHAQNCMGMYHHRRQWRSG